MSAFAHPQQSITPSPHQPPYVQDPSALHLLSRVALEQYPSTPPPQSSSPPKSIWPTTNPPVTNVPQTPPLPTQQLSYPRQISSLPYSSHFDKSRPVFSADFSPVSSDDGSSSRRTHPPPHLPQRLNKIMRVSKEHSSVKTRTQPSRFCHICSRTSKKVGLIACGNFATGACRKVVCQKCFNDHDWDWEAALKKGSKWICTHCRQECPDRAQCAIYKRTNERRREQQQRQKVVIRSDATGSMRGGHGRFINNKGD